MANGRVRNRYSSLGVKQTVPRLKQKEGRERSKKHCTNNQGTAWLRKLANRDSGDTVD